jgi:methyl-accepting chemotaxis protein
MNNTAARVWRARQPESTRMLKKISADTLLNLAILALLIGIVNVSALSYYFLQSAEERSTAALHAGRDLGAAVASARAADAAARVQAQAVERLLAAPAAEAAGTPSRPVELPRDLEELVQKHLDEARQLLGKHAMDTARLEDAKRLGEKLAQQTTLRLQQTAAGGPAPAAADRWSDVAPGVESVVQRHGAIMADQVDERTQSMAIFMAVMVLIGIGVAWLLRSLILRANVGPLIAATRMAEQIAAGDLTAKAEGMDQPHTRRLARALDGMTSNLRGLASEVVRSAQTVADTSAQIAQGNLDLSQRTEEQASTLEETASSMEELTSTVAHNADNARQASQLAVGASEVARKGGEVVGQVVATMTDISQSSRRIGDIIGVIDGIAFQTNILALNAAVEAARAGEQGRGFAVVAQEVRNLAQRSAAAAKEIKALIGDSVGKVEAGTKLVDSAGRTMVETVESVRKVRDLIAEIAAASQEQSAGIGQVNTAVAQMEQVVQQNASLVEQASAAAESMKEQASALLNAVSRFRLAEHAAVAPQLQQPVSRARPSITVRPSPELPAAYAASPRKPQVAAGSWEEF